MKGERDYEIICMSSLWKCSRKKIVDKGVPVDLLWEKPMVELTANTTDGALGKTRSCIIYRWR